MTFYNTIYICMNFFTLYIIKCFFKLFFPISEKRVKVALLAYAVYFFITSIVYFAFDIPILNLAVNIALMVCISLCYEGSLMKRLLCVGYLYALLFAVEIIVSVMTGKISINPTEKAEYGEALGLFCNKLISFLLVWILGRLINEKKKNSLPLMLFATSISIPILTIIVEVLVAGTASITRKTMLVSMLGLLIVNAVAFFLFDSLAEAYEQRYKNEAAIREREYYYHQCVLMQQAANDVRSFQHDANSHYSVLLECLNANSTEEAKKYLNKLVLKSQKVQHLYSKTGNIIIDSIINYKLCSFSDEIRIDIDTAVPTELPIDIVDLSIILSNLLDNAIEALSKIIEQRKLTIKIVYQKGMLLISVCNTYDGMVSYQNGEIISEKPDSKHHGYGLKNINKAVEKYDGCLEISHDDMIFTAEALLYLNSPNTLAQEQKL